MKKHSFLFFTYFLVSVLSAQGNTSNDGNWLEQRVVLTNTFEADFMIRVGDIDNLGFGYEEGFDPFCGRSTNAHAYPWEANTTDMPGTDKILIPSSMKNDDGNSDGYAFNSTDLKNKPVPIVLPTEILAGVEIKNAFLQVLIDDFQSPEMGSKFQATINGKRFIEFERILSVINQSGPIGKLITVQIPEEFYASLKQKEVKFLIDDPTTGVHDGFAIDFVKLIVNRKTEMVCRGDISGFVRDKETNEPIAGAKIEASDHRIIISDNDGYFTFKDLPAGLEVLIASAKDYSNGEGVADIGKGSDNGEIYILLEKSKGAVEYDGKKLKEGESTIINNILFDQGSANLNNISTNELNKILQFMQSNPTAVIELSGHTSSEGDINLNKSLSYKRVQACKDYLVAKGVNIERIVVVGFGPDRPIASNTTEEGRKQNRRVEMRILQL